MDYMDYRKCDVCKKIADLKVCSSDIAPIAFAYCENCLNKGLEPYSALLGLLITAGSFENMKPVYQDFILYNLKEQDIAFEKYIEDAGSVAL